MKNHQKMIFPFPFQFFTDFENALAACLCQYKDEQDFYSLFPILEYIGLLIQT